MIRLYIKVASFTFSIYSEVCTLLLSRLSLRLNSTCMYNVPSVGLVQAVRSDLEVTAEASDNRISTGESMHLICKIKEADN